MISYLRTTIFFTKRINTNRFRKLIEVNRFESRMSRASLARASYNEQNLTYSTRVIGYRHITDHFRDEPSQTVDRTDIEA